MGRLLSKTTLLTILFIFLWTPFVSAQNAGPVTITGQIRERTEYDAKDFDANNDNVWFHLLRTRLNVAATPVDDVRAFVQFQDSRLFGEETNTLTDGSADQFDVHQAYIQVSRLFDTPITARLGRQEINVGNQRLVGAVGWHNIGRSFDALHVTYPFESGSLTIFAAKLVGLMSTPDSENLYGATGTFPVSDNTTLQVLALLDNDTTELQGGPDEGKPRLSRYTIGGAANGKLGAADFELEAYFQGGNQARGAQATRASLSAYLISGKVGVVIAEERNVRLGGLFTIVSGDDTFGDDEYNAFNTLFATNHKFYGYMDYFLSFGGPSGFGLQDIAVSLGLDASELFRLSLDFHHFMADNTPSGLGDTYGQEIDVTGVYRYNRALTFTVGVSAFAPGELMELMQGEDTAFWAYVMTVVNL